MMATPIKKAAGGFGTTTATASQNATDFIVAGAHQASEGAAFRTIACAGIGRKQYRAVRHRDSISFGASHTTDNAGNLPDSEVFSRLKFRDGLNFQGIYSFGAGSVYPQGRQHGVIHVTKPSPTRCPSQVASGFQSRNGAKTMSMVNTITTPKVASLGNTPAFSASIIARQQEIENALSTALYFIRLPLTESGLKAATGRAIRAASMLKQACSDAKTGGAA